MKLKAQFRQRRSSCFRDIFPAVIFLLVFAFAVTPGNAQSTGGRFRGTVMDPSGGGGAAPPPPFINEAAHATPAAQSSAHGGKNLFVVARRAGENKFIMQGFEKK